MLSTHASDTGRLVDGNPELFAPSATPKIWRNTSTEGLKYQCTKYCSVSFVCHLLPFFLITCSTNPPSSCFCCSLFALWGEHAYNHKALVHARNTVIIVSEKCSSNLKAFFRLSCSKKQQFTGVCCWFKKASSSLQACAVGLNRHVVACLLPIYASAFDMQAVCLLHAPWHCGKNESSHYPHKS